MPLDATAQGPPDGGTPAPWVIVAWVPSWGALDVLSRSARMAYAATEGEAILVATVWRDALRNQGVRGVWVEVFRVE